MTEEHISALLQDLDGNRPREVQERAVSALANLGPAVLPRLWTGSDKRHWENIVRVIRTIGYPANAPAIPALIGRLMDLNWPGSTDAAEELIQIGEPIIPYLRKVLREHLDDDDWIWGVTRLVYRTDLVVTTRLAPELLRVLNERRDDPEWESKWAAIDPLARVGSPAADAAIPRIAEMAADQRDPDVYRLEAISALRNFSAAAHEVARPYLERCLEDPSEEIRYAARTTLEAWQRQE